MRAESTTGRASDIHGGKKNSGNDEDSENELRTQCIKKEAIGVSDPTESRTHFGNFFKGARSEDVPNAPGI